MAEGKVVLDITTSLNGFIAGPNDGVENPMGDGGERLLEWVYDLASRREPHGLTGGKTNRDAEILDGPSCHTPQVSRCEVGRVCGEIPRERRLH
jgi:hypothetical protein